MADEKLVNWWTKVDTPKVDTPKVIIPKVLTPAEINRIEYAKKNAASEPQKNAASEVVTPTPSEDPILDKAQISAMEPEIVTEPVEIKVTVDPSIWNPAGIKTRYEPTIPTKPAAQNYQIGRNWSTSIPHDKIGSAGNI